MGTGGFLAGLEAAEEVPGEDDNVHWLGTTAVQFMLGSLLKLWARTCE